MNVIQHIRARLRSRGGNSFYRDNSIRETHTLCGAEVTDKDFAWRDKVVAWSNEGVDYAPCVACMQKKSEMTRK